MASQPRADICCTITEVLTRWRACCYNSVRLCTVSCVAAAAHHATCRTHCYDGFAVLQHVHGMLLLHCNGRRLNLGFQPITLHYMLHSRGVGTPLPSAIIPHTVDVKFGVLLLWNQFDHASYELLFDVSSPCAPLIGSCNFQLEAVQFTAVVSGMLLL